MNSIFICSEIYPLISSTSTLHGSFCSFWDFWISENVFFRQPKGYKISVSPLCILHLSILIKFRSIFVAFTDYDTLSRIFSQLISIFCILEKVSITFMAIFRSTRWIIFTLNSSCYYDMLSFFLAMYTKKSALKASAWSISP